MRNLSKATLTILHGYRLDGSGSCVYVQNLTRVFAQMGVDVLLVCQELRPDRYPFISEAYEFLKDGQLKKLFTREQPGKGRVISFRPYLENGLLPVYVEGKTRTSKIKSFSRLIEKELTSYIDNNVSAVTNIAKKYPFDLIYANHIIMMPYIAAVAAKKIQGLRYYLVPHGSEIEYILKKDPRYLPYAERSLTEASGILSGTEEMSERISLLFGGDDRYRKKTDYVSTGVDVDQFSSPRKTSISERKKGLQSAIQDQTKTNVTAADSADTSFLKELDRIDFSEGKTVTYFGRLIPAKGVQDLIVAAPLLCKAIPNLKIMFAGEGPYKPFFQKLVQLLQSGDKNQVLAEIKTVDRDSSTQFPDSFRFVYGFFDAMSETDYFSLASSFKWADQVHFTGYLKHESLRYLLCLSDVAVFPSIVKEAYPLSLLEAMAAGAFPVVSDDGGLRDGTKILDGLYDESVTRLMRVEMKENSRILAMKDQIIEACDVLDEKMRTQMVQRVREKCDWKVVCNMLLNAFGIHK